MLTHCARTTARARAFLVSRAAARGIHAGCATAEGTAAFCARTAVEWPATMPRTSWSVSRVGFGSPWLGAGERDMERAFRVALGVPASEGIGSPAQQQQQQQAPPVEGEWTLGADVVADSATGGGGGGGGGGGAQLLQPRSNLISVPAPPAGWALGASPDWRALEASNAQSGADGGRSWQDAHAADWAPRVLDIALSSAAVAREEIVVSLALDLPAADGGGGGGGGGGGAGQREAEAFLEEELTRALEWLALEKVDMLTVRLPAAPVGGAATGEGADGEVAAAAAAAAAAVLGGYVPRVLAKLAELAGEGRTQAYALALPRATTRRAGEVEAAAEATAAYMPQLLAACVGGGGGDGGGSGAQLVALQVDSAWAHTEAGRSAMGAAADAGLTCVVEGCLDALDSRGMPVRLLDWWQQPPPQAAAAAAAAAAAQGAGESAEGAEARARAGALQAAYNDALALEQAYAGSHATLETVAAAAKEKAAASAAAAAMEDRAARNPATADMMPEPPRMPLLPAPRELSWAAILAHSHERLRNYHEWRIIFERTLKPQLAAAVKATGLHGKSGIGRDVLDLTTWSSAYLVAMRAVVGAFGDVLEHKARAQTSQVRAALDVVAPALASSPSLEHRVMRTALSASADVVLVADAAALEVAAGASAQQLRAADVLGEAEQAAIAEAWAPGGELVRSVEEQLEE
jgi:hypothetical protein